MQSLLSDSMTMSSNAMSPVKLAPRTPSNVTLEPKLINYKLHVLSSIHPYPFTILCTTIQGPVVQSLISDDSGLTP